MTTKQPKRRVRTLSQHPGVPSSPLSLIGGVWHLHGVPVKAGELVEVRRARVGAESIGEDWFPAVIGEDGALVELEEPGGDFVPGSRSAEIRAAGLRTLSLSLAEIRRPGDGGADPSA